jgi:hypothetical protein
MTPLVPIIVTGKRYLAECLGCLSALESDFPFDVIVADDGSTDGTRYIGRRYRDPRNAGATTAIDHACSFVRGDFVARWVSTRRSRAGASPAFSLGAIATTARNRSSGAARSARARRSGDDHRLA